jgi:two-component system, cell cycle sensor histidine kinase and response regulator CckA
VNTTLNDSLIWEPTKIPLLERWGFSVYTGVRFAVRFVGKKNPSLFAGGLEENMAELEQIEKALRESEERFRTLVENVPVGVFRTTPGPKGEFLMVNPAFLNMYGFDSTEALEGKSVADLYANPDERKMFSDRILAQGSVTGAELRLKKKDGSLFWGSVTIKAIRDENGPVAYFDGVIEDITARKRAEDLIRAQHDLALQLGAAVGLDETLRLCVEAAIRGTEMDGGGVYLVDEISRDLNLAFSTGLSPEFIAATSHYDVDAPNTRLIMEGRPIYIQYQDLDVPMDETRRREGLRVIAILPVSHEGRVIACMNITSRSLDQVPTATRDTLETIAAQIGSFVARARAEEALQESKQFLQSVFDGIQDGINVLDTDLNLVRVNAWMERMYASQMPLQGKKCYSVYPQRESPCPWCPALSTLDTGKVHSEVVPYPSEQDPAGWIELSAFPLKDAAGRVVGIIEHVKDITEHKQVEEALRASEERFRTLFELSPYATVYTDLEGNILACNQEFVNMHGLDGDTEAQVGKNVAELFSEKERPFLFSLPNKTVEKSAIEGPIEYTMLREDGTAFPTETKSTLIRDQDGKPVAILGIAYDITERKRAEAEREHLLAQIQEQARRVQQIVDTVPEGVFLLNADGQVILANPLAERELVALADAKVGDTLTHLGDRPLAELLTSPPQGLWHPVKADRRSFQVIARPMESGPETQNWVLVVRDVTQQHEMERRAQQQERLAAVGQLAAGIAHDFNNILATVILYAQMSAREEGIPTRVRERMETINEQARHATRLTQQILDFSRRAVLERRPMDLLIFLKEQIKLLERTLPESIQIELSYGPDEYAIHADPTRIQQMVMNLSVNARDAMSEGGNLRIKLERIQIEDGQEPPLPEMEPGEWIELQVTDTGSGIPPDILPHIFDPFFTTKPVGVGTGLGLAQVWGIVTQHEGHIDVTTRIGEGTTFTIYLPPLSIAPLEELPLETEALFQGEGETILVVEDNETMRKALVETLALLNYRVLEAANGLEALALLEQNPFQPAEGEEIALVLSDMVMPEMGGQALLNAMRERGLSLPVVVLSGHPVENELKNLRAQGLAGWLLKPPRLEELAQLLAQALNR